MPKKASKILSLLILFIYLTSTVGLVISHIHCACEKEDKFALYTSTEKCCTICSHSDNKISHESCCSGHLSVKHQHKGCCGSEVKYLKLNSKYFANKSFSIVSISSFAKQSSVIIESKDQSLFSTYFQNFLIEDIPKISGKEMLFHLHQLKLDPANMG